jgi:hypothetical protein
LETPRIRDNGFWNSFDDTDGNSKPGIVAEEELSVGPLGTDWSAFGEKSSATFLSVEWSASYAILTPDTNRLGFRRRLWHKWLMYLGETIVWYRL